MKIKSVTKRSYESIEIESEAFWSDYRRYENGDWEVLMGDSWESIYDHTKEYKELEKAYQDYIKTK